MEEWFFLDRIALGSRRVSPRYVELAAAVEANFSNSGLPFGNRAAMAAGEAAQAIVFKPLDKPHISLADALVKNGAQGRHLKPF